MPNPTLLPALARAFLAGEQTAEDQTVDAIVARASGTLGRNWRWLRPLARRYASWSAGEIRPRVRDVIDFFSRDPGFRRAWSNHFEELRIARWLTEPQRMQPAPAAANWDVPVIESVGALADWLEVTPDELLWFADLKGLAYKTRSPRLGHYHYACSPKNPAPFG